jgi:hypothetical protein
VAAAPAVGSSPAVPAAAPARTVTVQPSAAPRVEVAAAAVTNGDANALTGGVVDEVVRL